MHLHLARLIASSFALISFTISVLVGLQTGNPAEGILMRALVSMAVAFIGGGIVGLFIEQVVRTHMRKIDAMAEQTIMEEDAVAGARGNGSDERGASAMREETTA
ncbi:MAG: hypothetical protein JNM94_00685 [Phycisphaerae bacterium]|nr:hypothetical protein [Phycisphaerae bacterium]